MAKKINVGNLLNAALNESLDPSETLKNLKEQRRDIEGVNIGNKAESNTKSVKARKQRGDRGSNGVQDLESFLALQNFSDRKEQFIFRLSQKCFHDYEALTRAINYKLKMNLTRNDIMRKVLEDYHKNNIHDLLNRLDKI